MRYLKLTQLIYFPLITLLMPQAAIAQKQMNHIEWNVAAELPAAGGNARHPGLAGAVSGIHNDVLIVAGGANFPNGMPWLGGKKEYHQDVYIFKIDAQGKLTSLHESYKLPFATAYGSSCSTPSGLVYAGGESSGGMSNKVLLLQWDKDSQKLHIKELPALPAAVSNAAATSAGNKVFVAGGETPDAAIASFRVLDLDKLTDGWKELPPLPKPVSHAVAAISGSRHDAALYLMGGRKKNDSDLSELYSSVYAFDFSLNRWTEKRSLPYPLSAGTGVAAGDNQILLFGGDRGETFNKTEALIVAISKEKDETRKAGLNRQKVDLQGSHPGFSKDVLLYDTAADAWSVIGTIPFDSPVTTSAIKWREHVIIPSGEVKAGIRTPQILVGKMK